MMTLNRVIAISKTDRTKAQRTKRSYLCNDRELQELRPRLETAGMRMEVTRETVGN